MVVHPEPTKNLIFVGDKYGMLGMYVPFLCRASAGQQGRHRLTVDGMRWARASRLSKTKTILPVLRPLKRKKRKKEECGIFKPTLGIPSPV